MHEIRLKLTFFISFSRISCIFWDFPRDGESDACEDCRCKMPHYYDLGLSMRCPYRQSFLHKCRWRQPCQRCSPCVANSHSPPRCQSSRSQSPWALRACRKHCMPAHRLPLVSAPHYIQPFHSVSDNKPPRHAEEVRAVASQCHPTRRMAFHLQIV